jgi:hypothetical protein
MGAGAAAQADHAAREQPEAGEGQQRYRRGAKRQ